MDGLENVENDLKEVETSFIFIAYFYWKTSFQQIIQSNYGKSIVSKKKTKENANQTKNIGPAKQQYDWLILINYSLFYQALLQRIIASRLIHK